MARIRSIKPEFWSSPNLPADPWARLLYMAMWTWADDNGVGTANERELLGFAFPNDDAVTLVDLRRMLVEIRRVFGVKFYTVAGRPYFAIPSWEKHQKFDRRSKGRYPGSEQAETQLYLGECSDSADTRGIPSSARRDSVVGTGEQGNRGTGEEETSSTPPASTPTASPASSTPSTSPTSTTYPPTFEEWWKVYPRRVGKIAALKAWKAATKKIDQSRLAEITSAYSASVAGSDPQFIPHPATWLNEGRYDDGDSVVDPEQVLRDAWREGPSGRQLRGLPLSEPFLIELPAALEVSTPANAEARDAEILRQWRAWIQTHRDHLIACLRSAA